MSKIGKQIIILPEKTEAKLNDSRIIVKGPKGELSQEINPAISVQVEGNVCTVTRPNDERENRAMHGLYRSLINNMVTGVSQGYKKTMELVGVGYRVSNNGQILEFALGYTHNIYLSVPNEIKIETKSERNQNPIVILESCDKQLLGQVCAKIRSFRKPEPYKGKGVKFAGEVLRRKAGKSAGAK